MSSRLKTSECVVEVSPTCCAGKQGSVTGPPLEVPSKFTLTRNGFGLLKRSGARGWDCRPRRYKNGIQHIKRHSDKLMGHCPFAVHQFSICQCWQRAVAESRRTGRTMVSLADEIDVVLDLRRGWCECTYSRVRWACVWLQPNITTES